MALSDINNAREHFRDNWAYPLRVEWPGVALTGSASETITQVAHGFARGTWVYNNAGTWTVTTGTPLPQAVVTLATTADTFQVSYPWTRYEDIGGPANVVFFGCNRHFGSVIISIFTPAGFGSRLGEVYADAVQAIMSRATGVTNYRFEPTAMRPGGDLPGWHQLITTTEYFRDEVAA